MLACSAQACEVLPRYCGLVADLPEFLRGASSLAACLLDRVARTLLGKKGERPIPGASPKDAGGDKATHEGRVWFCRAKRRN